MIKFADDLPTATNRAAYLFLAANAKRRLNRVHAEAKGTTLVAFGAATIPALADYEKCFAALAKNCNGNTAAAEAMVARRVEAMNP